MLHIFLLGEQSIGDAAGVLRMRSARTVALVAYLALHAGLPQSRQRIAALFWPDSTEAQALTNLRRELHHLRNALDGEPALVVTAKDLCWRDTETCSVDARIFEREGELAIAATARGASDDEVLAHASAAIKEYRGDYLPGGYDDWLLEARSTFEDRCVELLDLVCETRTRAGELKAAVDAVRRRIELRPLEEVGYRALMGLQADLGERSGAVSTYHHCASVLEQELGIEPDPATRALLDSLLARVDTTVSPVVQRSAGGRSGLAAAALVGRSLEFAVLDMLWHTAAAGRPSLAIVRGDPGVGKTRLVTDVADTARSRGAVVATAQCFGTSGRLALSPVADWLRTPAVQSGLATLEPFWRVEVDRLVPSGKARMHAVTAAPTTDDAWQRHRFFEGLARALIGVGRPLLLVVDNLQWCDQETLAFLTFFLGLTTDAPVMVAATLRTDEYRGEPELQEWTARMHATGISTEVVLGPLEIADTALLAQAISGCALSDDDASLLHATTGGFPLYVVEAVRGAVDPASNPLPVGDLSAVLRNRFEQVSPAARDIAGLAAAVGRDFTLDLLTEASDLDADSVVAAVDELWRRRIVREIGDGYDFSHDLLRDSAYAQVSPPQRWLLHRRLAQGLELLHAEDPDAVSAELANQYVRGGRPERAVGYYRRAADLAAGMFAHAEAIRLHREALTILRAMPPTRERAKQELDVLESLAAPLNAGYGYSSPELRDTVERAIALAEELGRRQSIVIGLVGLWTAQFVHGEVSASFQTASRALALVETNSALSGTVHFALGGSAVSLGRPADAVAHLELVATLGGVGPLTVGTRPDVHARAFAAHAHWLLGNEDEALANCYGAITLARPTVNPYSLAVALAYAAITHQMRQDLSALRETVDELRQLCNRYDFAYYREWALILDGWSRPDGSGLELARRGIENLTAEGAFVRMPYWLSLLADLAARNDQHDRAHAILDAAVIRAKANDDLWWLPEVMRMRAVYDAPDDRVARLRSAAELAAAQGSVALARRCANDIAAPGLPT